jgi:HEAT repeat protein
MLDIISLLAGAAVALVLGILIYSQRERITSLRSSATRGVVTARRKLGRGLDARYRDAVISLANTRHLAGNSIPLERVAVMPHFYTLPRPHDPLEEEGQAGYEGPLQLVPLTPDWPHAIGPYHIPGIPLERVLRGGDNVAVLGLPGSGRSTALALMALLVARQHDSGQQGGLLSESRLPILVHLGDVDLSPETQGEGTDPIQPLLDAAGAQIGGFVGAALGSIRRQFTGGGGLILLDAWDELPIDRRMKVAAWLRLVMETYPGNQFVIAAAPTGFKPLYDIGFAPVFMRPWHTPEYTELAELWAAAWPEIGGSGKNRPPEPEPSTIQAAVRGNRSRTPLEVTLKVWAAFAKDDPGLGQIGWFRAYVNRSVPADLRGALERIAEQWVRNPESSGPTLEELNRTVDSVRNSLTQKPSVSTPDFIHAAMNQSHILAGRADRHVTFTQPMVAAYLAAEALKSQGQVDILLDEHPVNDLVMPFLAQLTDISPYVQTRLAEAETLLQQNMLALAGWASDADASAAWRPEVFKQLTALFLGSAEFPLVRERTMAALVASRDRNVAFIFRNGLQNPDARVRILSAIGLGALGDPEQLIPLGESLTDADPWVETAVSLALGALGTKAAMNYMIQTFLSGRELARRAVGEMLATNIAGEGHDILREGMQENDPQTRRAAIYGLQTIGADWCLELLRQSQNRDDQWVVRTAATGALEMLEDPPLEVGGARARIPEKSDWLVVWLAERDQAIEPGPRAISQMIRALQEGDENTRIAAAEALGALNMAEAISPLYAALRDQSHLVRDAAYRSLGRISLALGYSLPNVA